MSSIFHNPGAFAPMYDETVTLSGTRPGGAFRKPARACVFDEGLDDPFADAASSTSRRNYTILVPDIDWLSADPPQEGDGVTRECGTKLAVMSVDRDPEGGWVLKARSIA